MARRKGTCLFCGASGPLTKEDAWPKWLNKLLPPPPGPGSAGTITLDDGGNRWDQSRPVHSFNTERIPVVCQSCNNGWMSRVQERARPTLGPMILGHATELTAEQQRSVAVWATMTAFVFDAKESLRGRIMTDEIVRRFGQQQEPVPGSRVYLANYIGTDWVLNRARRAMHVSVNGHDPEPTVLIMSLSVGQLILQVIAPAASEAAADVRRLNRDDDAFANTVFPVQNALQEWPPGIGITSSRFLEFGDVEI